MEYQPTRRLFWHAKRAVGAFGWPGMTAILLLAGAFAFGIFTLQPLQERVAALRAEAKSLRAQSKAKSIAPKVLNPAEQLAEFYRFFPAQDTVTDAMAVLYNDAAQQNLSLEQAEYRLVHGRDDKLTRYEVVLPVKGGYVQIRKFIAQVLVDVPNLSLDAVNFNRQKIGDTLLDAQMKFTFHLGKA
jgi:Tfp pilus assembly protein PilO